MPLYDIGEKSGLEWKISDGGAKRNKKALKKGEEAKGC